MIPRPGPRPPGYYDPLQAAAVAPRPPDLVGADVPQMARAAANVLSFQHAGRKIDASLTPDFWDTDTGPSAGMQDELRRAALATIQALRGAAAQGDLMAA